MGRPSFALYFAVGFLTAEFVLGWTNLAHAIEVDPTELTQTIAAERTQIPEFKQIAKEARKRGLRVFATGGLAASIGDFSKHLLLNEKGLIQVRPDRLTSELGNVVLPLQDLDLAITRADGRAESADEVTQFQTWLDSHYPASIDGKTRWDVAGLKTSVGKHLALQDNPDFYNQNNDTLSIGMIELTDPPVGEPLIHDLHPGQKSLFLRDLARDRIEFLESAKHAKTTFAKQGRNPPILGAIRVVAKALQFDKEIDPASLNSIKKIISDFNPRSVDAHSYVANWIEGRSKRLLLHAYDPEKALQFLEDIGLRHKLLEIEPGAVSRAGSSAWWLMKAPLSASSSKPPSIAAPMTKGTGKTAAELGVRLVTHESSPLAHRLMSWRYDGVPRLFASRKNEPGESAMYSEGFYTVKGTSTNEYRKNAIGAALRFAVDPNAIDGKDFTLENGNLLIWRNAEKLKVANGQNRASDRSFACGVLYAQLTAIGSGSRGGAFRSQKYIGINAIILGTAFVGWEYYTKVILPSGRLADATPISTQQCVDTFTNDPLFAPAGPTILHQVCETETLICVGGLFTQYKGGKGIPHKELSACLIR